MVARGSLDLFDPEDCLMIRALGCVLIAYVVTIVWKGW